MKFLRPSRKGLSRDPEGIISWWGYQLIASSWLSLPASCRTRTFTKHLHALRNNIAPFHGAVRKVFWCILPSKHAPGAHQASRGGGRGQCPPKPSFGHAAAVLSALTPKAKRPRLKLPPRPECPFKSTRKCRCALAWLRAPRTPAAPPELDFCAVAATSCAAPRAQFSCRSGATIAPF